MSANWEKKCSPDLSGSKRKGQKDKEKSLRRYVEDDWKQMLAAVRGEAERNDDSEGYLSLKDGETEIKWLSLSRGKDRKYFFYIFEQKKHKINSNVDH